MAKLTVNGVAIAVAASAFGLAAFGQDAEMTGSRTPFCDALSASMAAAQSGRMAALAKPGGAEWEPAPLSRLAPPFTPCAQAVEGFELCSLNSEANGFAWVVSNPATENGAAIAAQALVDNATACFSPDALVANDPPWAAGEAVVMRESWISQDGAARLTIIGETFGQGRGAVSMRVAERDASAEASIAETIGAGQL